MASAQCQIIDGKPTNCTPADTSNSGMFVGANESTLGTVALTSLNAFYWQDFQALGGYGPSNGSGGNYTDLKFVFSSGDNNIEGNGTADNPYTITIGSQSNRVFLLNAGNKGLILKDIKGNTGKLYTLDIDFSGFTASDEKFTFILNAKKLDGNIALSGGGIFKAHLAEGLTGAITNNGTEATFDFTANTLNLGTDKTHNKFSIWATEGGKNIIDESTLALETAGNITAGMKGDGSNSQQGTNNITVASLTMTGGDISTAGTGGSKEGEGGYSLNSISAGSGNIVLKGAKGSIIAYFHGENRITAGNLTLENGSIVAGDGIKEGGAKNTINLGAGKLTLKGTGDATKGHIIASHKGNNEITAGAIDTAGNISADGGTNAIKLTGALTFKGTGQYAGNIISNNNGLNDITADSLTLTGDLSANSGGNNTLTLKGATVTNSSIAGNIIANGGANTLNVNKGSFEVKGLIVAESGGANNFTLGSSEAGGNQVTLTLNGANNAIGTLDMKANSAFISNGAGTLTIGTLTAKDASTALTFKQGTNTIEGKVENTQATFNVESGVSLTFSNEITGTGSINLKDKATLTLNGGKLNELKTITAGTNTITFATGETTIANGITAENNVINNFTLTGSTGDGGTKATINGAINAATDADKNNFKLDSSTSGTTNLTLGGAGDKTLTSLTALSADSKAMNTLTITNDAGASEITTLNLGEQAGDKGFLTITNNSENALTITELASAEANNVLTIAQGKGAVIIDKAVTDAKFDLKGATLTLNNSDKATSTIASLTTTGTNNINFVKDTTTINGEITTSGTNNFKLTGTQNATSAVFEGAISGTNNFTLDSTNGATALTLNGDTNQIANFTALGGSGNQNTLTITSQSTTTNEIKELVLGNGSAKGLLTIDNQAVGKVLTIGTFKGEVADSKLTISAGAVNIGKLGGTGANNNIVLNDGTSLTLNGGTLKSLTTAGTTAITFASNTTTITSGITAGAGVKNNISLGDNATLASNITADGASAENNITLKGKSATIEGKLIQKTSGTNKISFDSQLESQTLTLQGNTNTITTLTLNNQSNNTINLAEDKDKNGGISSRTNEFRLLTIGTPTPNANTGLLNPNGATLTFESYINPKADQTKATLGEVPSQGDGKGKYGYAYSDRVIIHNAGENTAQAKGKYKFKAYYSNSISENDLKSINYTKDKGTEQEGNIALFTIAKVNDGSNQGIIEFDTQDNNNSQIKSTTRAGLDAITTALIKVETDENGKTMGNKNYFTYFVNKIQQGSVSDEGRDITRDANLMIQSMAVSAVNLYLANFNSLNKRMGELRDNAYSKGVWARTFIGSQSNELGLSDQMGYFSIQAGFDGALKREKANNFIGFAISYSKNFGYSSTKNNARSLNSGERALELGIDSLNSQLLELALYNSYVSNEGWYNDTIGKFSYIQNSMSVKDRLGANAGGINGASGKFNTFAFTLSNEVGYRAKLGEDKAWFIDPQAELAIGHINGVNFGLNHYRINQATATISSAINLRARAGASIGYDFKNFTQDKGIDAKVYVGAFYEMDYFHYTDGSQGIKYTTKLKDTREVKMLDTDHRAVLNVGTNLTIKDATRLYLDFEKSFGGKITTDYKINAGVRYSFGEGVSEKSKEVLKDKEGESVDSESKAPLKLEKGDK